MRPGIVITAPLADGAQRAVALQMLADIRRYVKAKQISLAGQVAAALREALTSAPVNISGCTFLSGGRKTRRR